MSGPVSKFPEAEVAHREQGYLTIVTQWPVPRTAKPAQNGGFGSKDGEVKGLKKRFLLANQTFAQSHSLHGSRELTHR